MTTLEADFREAVLNGHELKLTRPDEPVPGGWYVRVGGMTIRGRSAAHVFFQIAEILTKSPAEGRGRQ